MTITPDRKLTNQFPRTDAAPMHSSKYWAKEKDRLLRQLLIGDIEQTTGRELITYFAQLDEGINHTDPDDLSEIIEGVTTGHIDLFIQTPGGNVDAVEKFISVLSQRVESYRVIVPSWAKSGGTVIAISANSILLGVNSELGPIDPQIMLPDLGQMPCEFICRDETKDAVLREYAQASINRTKGLTKKIMQRGMLSNLTEQQIDETIDKLSSSNRYNSHGAVIDFGEAEALGLSVEWMPPGDELWRRVWLLYCLYDQDTKNKGLGRVIEGAVFSITRPASEQLS